MHYHIQPFNEILYLSFPEFLPGSSVLTSHYEGLLGLTIFLNLDFSLFFSLSHSLDVETKYALSGTFLHFL